MPLRVLNLNPWSHFVKCCLITCRKTIEFSVNGFIKSVWLFVAYTFTSSPNEKYSNHKRKSPNFKVIVDITVEIKIMNMLQYLADNVFAELHRSESLHQQ